jgi:hypothetical protein
VSQTGRRRPILPDQTGNDKTRGAIRPNATCSVVRLKVILDHEGTRLPLRTDGTGKTTGGGLISRGHLYKILSNPIYLGRLTHKGQAHDGLHDPIGWNQGDYE